MDHIAILNKDWGLLPKLVSGEKTIESRWYQVRARPWNMIFPNETIYFKNGGEAVSLRARIAKVEQVENLSPEKVNELIFRYGAQLGLRRKEYRTYSQRFAHKKYALFIFLTDVEPVTPFLINKNGFGAQAAWLTVPSITELRQK